MMDPSESYNEMVEKMRSTEYPMLNDNIYLDHAGTTMYAKSLLEGFSQDMVSGLYGNPHSASPSSHSSTRRVEDARLAALSLFNADPKYFDLVFTANATAGIKLIQEAFMSSPDGFWYGYHIDSHTSLIGVRESATAGSVCFGSDQAVENWLADMSACNVVKASRPTSTDQRSSTPSSDTSYDSVHSDDFASMPGSWSSTEPPDMHEADDPSRNNTHDGPLQLLAYPAQSNMNGRRLPLSWCRRLRQSIASGTNRQRYTLLDAAALVSTTPLDLSDDTRAPDFTVLSFYKIFGFPDLGALIVRKDAASILGPRRYFGGGTVDMVTSFPGTNNWHVQKSSSPHGALEDGTLPIHSIIALSIAIRTHEKLFGSFKNISRHTAGLTQRIHDSMSALKHANSASLCKIHAPLGADYGDSTLQGPIIAFNLLDSQGKWISNSEVERLASIHNIHLRSGGLCNPGGIMRSLGLTQEDSKRTYGAGYRCGGEVDIVDGKPTGVLRVSLGAMSTVSDTEAFLDFLKTFFLETTPASPSPLQDATRITNEAQGHVVDAIVVYPIKSCRGWPVPRDQRHDVLSGGLEWDREWCVVQTGTREVLSQKKFPRMALIEPRIDLECGMLRIHFQNPEAVPKTQTSEVSVPLRRTSPDQPTRPASSMEDYGCCTLLCGDKLNAEVYMSAEVTNFLSKILGVPCQLARSQSKHTSASSTPSMAQAHPSRSLANESPILAITTSSLARLNADMGFRQINQGFLSPDVPASVFRPNLVLRPVPQADVSSTCQSYAEDHWQSLHLPRALVSFDVLGPCRRCQMVCVDQETGEKRKEPFITLSKTRRRQGGGVYFGVGIRLTSNSGDDIRSSIRVGDEIIARMEAHADEGATDDGD